MINLFRFFYSHFHRLTFKKYSVYFPDITMIPKKALELIFDGLHIIGILVTVQDKLEALVSNKC